MSPAPPIAIGSLRENELSLVLASYAPHPFHHVPTYSFVMTHAASGHEMGKINLRTESTPHILLFAGHIGYSVHREHRGHRYASRSVKLLLPLARQLQLDPVWITCDPDNLASRRSCELAGAELVEIVDITPDYPGYEYGQRQKCRYRL
jgi:predicted acetyltransferase